MLVASANRAKTRPGSRSQHQGGAIDLLRVPRPDGTAQGRAAGRPPCRSPSGPGAVLLHATPRAYTTQAAQKNNDYSTLVERGALLPYVRERNWAHTGMVMILAERIFSQSLRGGLQCIFSQVGLLLFCRGGGCANFRKHAREHGPQNTPRN